MNLHNPLNSSVFHIVCEAKSVEIQELFNIFVRCAMNILYNNEELLQLMSNLCVLTGIRSNIFDLSGKDVCLDYERQPFCELMNSIPEGHMRCVECDKREVAQCAKTKKSHFYRCQIGRAHV